MIFSVWFAAGSSILDGFGCKSTACATCPPPLSRQESERALSIWRGASIDQRVEAQSFWLKGVALILKDRRLRLASHGDAIRTPENYFGRVFADAARKLYSDSIRNLFETYSREVEPNYAAAAVYERRSLARLQADPVPGLRQRPGKLLFPRPIG